MSADLAAIVAEAQRLLDGATPGPWTCEPVGYGQHAVIPDARHEIFVEVAADAALIAAAPDLARHVIALAARLTAAEADRDYWREQMTATAPCVDEIRRLTLRVVRGGTGCALDPVLAVDTALASLDGLMVAVNRAASERDAAAASAAAAVARADAAIAAHAALAAAVRAVQVAVAEYEAAWAAHIADGTPISAAEGVMAMSDRVDTARAALDALLRGAPAGYVRADVVAEYLAAESARNVSTVEAQSRRVAARTALDAALAAAGGGR